MLTAHGTVDNAVEAMKLGAFDYLQKPIGGPDELRLLVARARSSAAACSTLERAPPGSTRGEPPLTYGDPAMAPVVDAIEKVARTDATVLLLGESGTGKEVAARADPRAERPRATGPFVAVNCAALGRDAARERAVRPREGRVHRRQRAPARPARAGRRRHVLPRRGRRAASPSCRPSSCACSRSDASSASAARRTHRGRRALDRRDQPRPARDDRRRALPRGPLPPPRGVPDRAAAAARAPGRPHPARARPARPHRRATSSAARPEPDRRRPSASWSPARWPGNVRELANALERAAILADGDVDRARRHLARGRPGDAGARRRCAGRGAAAARRARARGDRCTRSSRVGGNRRRAAELLGIGERTLYDKLKRYGID